MLKATIIWSKSGQAAYLNALGETFYLDEFYDELELPFYACYIPTERDGNMLIAAFQEKDDLIDWISLPYRKSAEKKIHSV
jgi:hypothetical protein